MADNIQIMRRVNTPQSLKTTQVDNIKVVLGNLSNEQQNLKSGLEKLIGSIFKSYKRNNFQNNKNLNLISSYFLLRNIVNKNGNFVQMLKSNKEQVLSDVNEIIATLINQTGIGDEIYESVSQDLKNLTQAEKNKKMTDDVSDIIGKMLQDFDNEKQGDGDSKEYVKHLEEKYLQAISKELQEAQRKIDQEIASERKTKHPSNENLTSFKNSLFRSILKTLNSMNQSVSGTTNRKTTEVQTKQFGIAGNIFTPKTAATISQNRLKQNVQKTISISLFRNFKNVSKNKIVVSAVNGVTSLFLKFGSFSDKRFKKIKKQISHLSLGIKGMNLRNIFNIRRMWQFGGRGVKKIGSFVWTGVKSVFNIGAFLVEGIFSISKKVISGVWNFAKGITNAVVGTVVGITKNVMKPILPMIFKFLVTPQGAFVAGIISHSIYDNVEKKFEKYSFGENNLKEGAKTLISNIRDFIKDINFKGLMKTLSVVGATTLYPILKQVFEALLPQNLMISGGKRIIGSALGSALGWATNMPKIMSLVKAAAFNPITWIAGASIATFVAMGSQIADTIEKVNKREDELNVGQHYAGSLKKFQNIRNKYNSRDGDFLKKNQNMILRALSSGYQQSWKEKWDEEVFYRRKDASSVISETIELGLKEDQEAKDLDNIIEFCNEESQKLDDERNSIIQATSGNGNKRELAFDMTLKVDGTRITTDLITKKLTEQQAIELRTKNFIARVKLLQMLKDRKFRDDNAGVVGEGEVKKYQEKVDNLINISNNSFSINESDLGQSIKFYTVDRSDKRGVDRTTIGGFEMMQKGAYYGFKENKGKIDWNNSFAVEQAINFTMGSILQGSELEEQSDMFDLKTEYIFRENQSIEQPQFLEFCEIFIDMLCESPTTIITDGYKKPNDPFFNFNRVCNSKRVREKLKDNGVEYKPQDPKMVDFFKMLIKRNPNFRKYFGKIVSEYAYDNIIKFGKRIIAITTSIQDGQELVCVTPFYSDADSELQMYKYSTISLKGWNDGGKTKLKPQSVSGTKHCVLVAVTSSEYRTSDNKFLSQVSEYPGDGSARIFYTKFNKGDFSAIMSNMAWNIAAFLTPYLKKYQDIEKDIEMSQNPIIAQESPVDRLMRSLDEAEHQVEDFVTTKFTFTEEQIKGDQMKKKELIESIKMSSEHFRDEFNKRNERAKKIIETATGATTNGVGSTSSSVGESNGTSSFSVVQEEDYTRINDVTKNARDSDANRVN